MSNQPLYFRTALSIIITIVFAGTSCSDDEVETDQNLTEEKPIEIGMGSSKQTYLGIEALYYAPSVEGNSSLLFAIPPNKDFAQQLLNSLRPIADEKGSIIVSVVTETNSSEYGKLLDSLAASSYVDASKVFLSGYSEGGTNAFQMGVNQN